MICVVLRRAESGETETCVLYHMTSLLCVIEMAGVLYFPSKGPNGSMSDLS